jgi:nucleotide-binding universal stress UspA family protein
MNSAEKDDTDSILVALLLDDTGQMCLRYACHRALHTGQSVTAVHIVHETPETSGVYHRSKHAAGLLPVGEIARRMLVDFIADWRREHPELQTVALQAYAVAGIPETRIPELAERTGADLIVLGCRMPRGRRRFFERCVARSVMRRARCPVMMIDGNGHPVSPESFFPGNSGTGPASAAEAG